ncbi:integrase [Caballeronia udeis]|uniref:Integrase n=1 Tax=Caballeronia udeis TaxID=1232866 RepID=A0ABW8MSR0_9BURK
MLLGRARRSVEQGASPSRSKVEKRSEVADALTFGKWAEKYFAEAHLADSTRDMRKSVYDRNLADEFGRLKLEEITPVRLMARCEKIKERGAAAPAVHAREIVLQVFRFINARGLKIENPAESIRPSAIARFKAHDRTLSPAEIHTFFNALEQTATTSTLRLAIRFMLLTWCASRNSSRPHGTKWISRRPHRPWQKYELEVAAARSALARLLLEKSV